MNIYARYFDQDTLVYSFDELMDFLSSIPDIRITPELVEDVRNYVESDMPYPKRYKIRPRVYFILIKTTAESLSAFKANRKNPQEQTTSDNEPFNKKEIRIGQLMEERKGWYKGTIIFKGSSLYQRRKNSNIKTHNSLLLSMPHVDKNATTIL